MSLGASPSASSFVGQPELDGTNRTQQQTPDPVGPGGGYI
jgi:hypothetical protein